MAAIGRRDGLSIAQAMPLIVCNYATIRKFGFRLHRREWLFNPWNLAKVS
jgi:hypothetical protein